MGPPLDKPFGLQYAERLADWSRANAELLRDLLLHELHSRREFAVEDPPSNRIRDRLHLGREVNAGLRHRWTLWRYPRLGLSPGNRLRRHRDLSRGRSGFTVSRLNWGPPAGRFSEIANDSNCSAIK